MPLPGFVRHPLPVGTEGRLTHSVVLLSFLAVHDQSHPLAPLSNVSHSLAIAAEEGESPSLSDVVVLRSLLAVDDHAPLLALLSSVPHSLAIGAEEGESLSDVVVLRPLVAVHDHAPLLALLGSVPHSLAIGAEHKERPDVVVLGPCLAIDHHARLAAHLSDVCQVPAIGRAGRLISLGLIHRSEHFLLGFVSSRDTNAQHEDDSGQRAGDYGSWGSYARTLLGDRGPISTPRHITTAAYLRHHRPGACDLPDATFAVLPGLAGCGDSRGEETVAYLRPHE